MATWEAWECAAQVGHIRYLYDLRIEGKNAVSHIRLCTGRTEVTFNGAIFKPYPVKHSDITFNLVDAETSLELASSKALAELFVKHSPPTIMLTIWRWRRELNSAVSLFTGQFAEAGLDNHIFKVKFNTAIGASNSNMVTYYTQRHCNHDMYGAFCGLQFSDLRVAWSAQTWDVAGPRLLTTQGFTFDQVYWSKGMVFYTIKVIDGEYDFEFEGSNTIRSIIQNGNDAQVELKYPLSPYLLKTGELVMAPSCNLEAVRCRDIFGNAARFAGWPDMPLRNYSAVDATKEGTGTRGSCGGPVDPNTQPW